MEQPARPAAASAPHTPSVPMTASIPVASADERPAVADVDAFAEAAKLFSFTGETPVQMAQMAAEDDSAASVAAEPSHTHKKHKAKARRRPKQPRVTARRAAAASLSFGTIVAVGLLAVSSTLPAAAVASPDTRIVGAAPTQLAGDVSVTGSDDIQAYVAPADSTASVADLDRSANYSTARMVDMAGTIGISNYSSAYFTNNPQCDVQWPFAVGVPISYGFGPRPGEFHKGVDFTPGNGAHIQAIADGVVRVAQQGYQGYGVAVIIDHEIDGQHWASLYGHMQYGSLQVHPGEHVKVGQYIGRTGNTGFSFGAHTHFEIRQNGVTPIDPMPWLRQHNKC
ncbi:M23 family metallopeptidase [Microbacterium sp.]|uniref:M23 family metallopeptidase n=1 Tax=Microbacterium sp. TaxID=51671 RepID=UPI003A924821